MTVLIEETKITKKKTGGYLTTVPKTIIKIFNYPEKVRWLVDFEEGKVYVEFIKGDESSG